MQTFKQYLSNKTLCTEALSNQLMYLQRYLNMPRDDRDINRAHANTWNILEFLGEIDYELPAELEGQEDYDIVDWLDNNDKPTLIKYGESLLNNRQYLDSSEQELYDAVDDRGFVRNEWLVHFSDDAYTIWRQQKFSYGTPYEDYQRLALTTHFTSEAKKYGGFNFAYELYDVKNYAFGNHGGRPKYGSEAILFRGDGIKIYHYGDDEPQVIFDGKSTNPPLIYIKYLDDGWQIDSNVTNGKLIRFDDIEKIGEWVHWNYAQYRKHLEPTK